MEETRVKGLHYIDARNDQGETTMVRWNAGSEVIAHTVPIWWRARFRNDRAQHSEHCPRSIPI
ncbi:hypothetical protein GA0061098_106014 [Bradyrhizobium shewense]|uniref:Uncharacterized protein n=1 Tax=Bradyrhizobium shewense TaxID=1761772 RepID=A0A1C3XV59_9BRAD|nr:hypothetical protein GA0061098_106014 [Bradyrhizobium shewense]